MANFSLQELERQSSRLKSQTSSLNATIYSMANGSSTIAGLIGSNDNNLEQQWGEISSRFSKINTDYADALETMVSRMDSYVSKSKVAEATIGKVSQAAADALDAAGQKAIDIANNIRN